ncbi:MAG: hypothetical protein JO002_04670 [Burkholderiaceae bacterium]|nr:hypothetical protein [Burkholderiaceae bacterium]
MKKLMLGLTLAAMASAAHADDGSSVRFYAGIGISHGGDSLGSGEIVPLNGASGPTIPFNIRPGTSAELRLGADYRISERFHLQASAGYADQSPQGVNGSLDFRENPVELMGFFNAWQGLRLGAGYRKSWAEFSGTGVASNWPGLGRYTSTNGGVLEIQYLFSEDGKYTSQHGLGGFSLRYVNESLHHDDFTINERHYEFGGVFYY